MARRLWRTSNWSPPKGSTAARGYGGRLQAERRRWEPIVQSGRVACVRCGLPIAPGARWHLDHDEDRVHYLGPAHAVCNLRAGGQKGNAIKRSPLRGGAERLAVLLTAQL